MLDTAPLGRRCKMELMDGSMDERTDAQQGAAPSRLRAEVYTWRHCPCRLRARASLENLEIP